VIFLFFALIAEAAVDLKVVPASFCERGEAVILRTASCSANASFTKAARACLEKLNLLEAELGREVDAIASSGAANQLSQNNISHSSYQHSIRAMNYLERVTKVAQQELSEYHKYVVSPDPFLSDRGDSFWLLDKMECYGGVIRQVNNELSRLSQKQQVYAKRRAQAEAHSKTLQGSAKNYGSENSLLEKRKGAPHGVGLDATGSSISGEENLQKK
jgi:hypothetical protein